MISDRGYVRVRISDGGRPYYSWPATRAQALAFIEADKERRPRHEHDLEPYPSCIVCGAVAFGDGTSRCHKHREATPCAIDGCTKGRKFANGVFDDATWVCQVHWRQVCPPRSPLRRTYNRFFRIARRLAIEKGRWPEELERRYWRFFSGMIARYHRGQGGFIDVGEINKMFGWDV